EVGTPPPYRSLKRPSRKTLWCARQSAALRLRTAAVTRRRRHVRPWSRVHQSRSEDDSVSDTGSCGHQHQPLPACGGPAATMTRLHDAGRDVAFALETDNRDKNDIVDDDDDKVIGQSCPPGQLEAMIDWPAGAVHTSAWPPSLAVCRGRGEPGPSAPRPARRLSAGCASRGAAAAQRSRGSQVDERPAAKLGDRSAMLYLARAHDTGDTEGLVRDWDRATHYYHRALASSGQTDREGGYDSLDTPAYLLRARLAELYLRGGYGLDADPASSSEIYGEAAEEAMAEGNGKLAAKYYALAEEAAALVPDDEEAARESLPARPLPKGYRASDNPPPGLSGGGPRCGRRRHRNSLRDTAALAARGRQGARQPQRRIDSRDWIILSARVQRKEDLERHPARSQAVKKSQTQPEARLIAYMVMASSGSIASCADLEQIVLTMPPPPHNSGPGGFYYYGSGNDTDWDSVAMDQFEPEVIDYFNMTAAQQLEQAFQMASMELGNFSQECRLLFFRDPAEFYRKCITLHFYGIFLYSFIVDTVIVGTLCVVGLLGNLLTFVVLSNDRSHMGTNFLLRCLCAADSVFLTECFLYSSLRSVYPITGWLKAYYHYFPYIIQWLWGAAMTTQMLVNWFVVLVTAERYTVVCRPFQASTWCSQRRVRLLAAGTLAYCVLFNLPRYFEWTVQPSSMGLLSVPCFNYTRYSAQDSWLRQNLAYSIVYRSLLYTTQVVVLPIAAIVFLNIRLISTLKAARRERYEMQSPVRSNSRSLLSAAHCSGANQHGVAAAHAMPESPQLKCITEGQHRSITLTIVVICSVFIICETPGMVHNILASHHRSETMASWSVFVYTVTISNALMVAKSSSNFVIYCCCGRKFRYILRRLLARWWRRLRRSRCCLPKLGEAGGKQRGLRERRQPGVEEDEAAEEMQNLLAGPRADWVEANAYAAMLEEARSGGSSGSDCEPRP
uniref:G_PROTEIN_RECEP_F1_2 domain-containing protein n=1 Tax=Macrostomum lignano TaxID=282301 RepID=A0A1I8JS69_9PLAT